MKKEFIGCLVALSVLTACTKKVDLPAEPANRILNYTIASADGDMPAVIDESDKTINIYLPYYLYQLKLVQTNITLSPGATVKPASGELVNIRDTGIVYTVTANNGVKSQYKLKVHVMQIPHTANEVSTATEPLAIRLGGAITVTGNNFLADTTLAYISLIGKDNVEHKLWRSTWLVSTTKMDGHIPNDKSLDTGLYKVKVTSLKESVILDYPVRLKYALPVFSVNDYKVSAKQGGTITLKGKDIRGLTRFSIRVATTGSVTNLVNYRDLQIVSFKEDEAVLRIPDDFPVGAYPVNPTASLWHYIVFEEKGPEFYGAAGFQITVTAK